MLNLGGDDGGGGGAAGIAQIGVDVAKMMLKHSEAQRKEVREINPPKNKIA